MAPDGSAEDLRRMIADVNDVSQINIFLLLANMILYIHRRSIQNPA